MLEFIGNPLRITRPLLGRLDPSPIGFRLVGSTSPETLLYIDLNDEQDPFGRDDTPHLLVSPSDFCASEDDIVLVEPNGRVVVLYQAKARSNALFLTNRCNAHCVMCPQPPGEDPPGGYLQSVLSILDLIREPPQALGITGGEASVRWDDLCLILTRIRERFPSTTIQLLTNGIRLRDHTLTTRLAEIGGKNLIVGVPLHGPTDSVHDSIVGIPGAFWSTFEAICNLERAGVFVELRTVLMRKTILHLEDWTEFVIRHLPFVGQVALMGLEPAGEAGTELENLQADLKSQSDALVSAIRRFRRVGMSAHIFNLPLCQISPSIWPHARQSISEWKRWYPEICDPCSARGKCGGSFSSWDSFKPVLKPLSVVQENASCPHC